MFDLAELLARPFPDDLTLDQALGVIRSEPFFQALLDSTSRPDDVRIRFVWRRGDETQEVHLHRTLAFWKTAPAGWTAGIDVSDSGGGVCQAARPKELA